MLNGDFGTSPFLLAALERAMAPVCLCQVSTPDALIQRKAIPQTPFIFWTGYRANRERR